MSSDDTIHRASQRSLRAAAKKGAQVGLVLIFLALAVAAEALFALAVLREHSALALGYHVGAVACTLSASALGLSVRFARVPKTALVGAGLLVMCAPVAGLLGLLCTVFPAWRAGSGTPEPKWFSVPLPRFQDRALANLSAGPVRRPGSPDTALERRIDALRTLRRMPAERATRLIRRALSDPSEDVRLLAFALLDQGERTIRQRLEQSSSQLKALETPSAAAASEADKERMAALQLAIAQAYFDLVHGEFLLGTAANEALAQAAEHAQAAHDAGRRGPSALLLARIYLRFRQVDDARYALVSAAAEGVARGVLAPLWAESYYLQRRFQAVTAALSALSPISARRAVLAPVVAYWQRRGTH